MNDDQILELLCERFPRTFARNPSGRQPLKLGIDRDLVARLGGTVSRSTKTQTTGGQDHGIQRLKVHGVIVACR